MIALFWIIAATLVLLLVAPPVLFSCLSLEPRLARRSLRAADSSMLAPAVERSLPAECTTPRRAA